MKAIIDSERLRVVVDHPGQDGPLVVFSNGMGAILDYWDTVVDALPDLTCVRFDRPGLGGSAVSDRSSRDIRTEVARIIAVADWVDPARSVVLVGHSYGGVLVEATARLHPDRVQALVTVDGTDPNEYADPTRRTRPAYARLITLVNSSGPIAAVTGTVLERVITYLSTVRANGPRLTPAQIALVATPMHVATIFHEDARLPGHCAEAIELETDRPMPNIPVHVLIGGQTGGLIVRRQQAWIERAERHGRMLGRRTHIEVFRSAHLMMLDVPSEVAAAIGSAVNGWPPASTATIDATAATGGTPECR
ncbi:MAG: alpha/beta hydrolase [Actinomycetes bacterium]